MQISTSKKKSTRHTFLQRKFFYLKPWAQERVAYAWRVNAILLRSKRRIPLTHSASSLTPSALSASRRRCVILFSFYISGWMELLLVLGPCAHSQQVEKDIYLPPHWARIDQFVYTYNPQRERHSLQLTGTQHIGKTGSRMGTCLLSGFTCARRRVGNDQNLTPPIAPLRAYIIIMVSIVLIWAAFKLAASSKQPH